ncbi:MAG: hypothetical protein LDL55_02500 [Armatimonadetes bacterium]|nr:hypothetical protein [Armatimonadota bacterium]
METDFQVTPDETRTPVTETWGPDETRQAALEIEAREAGIARLRRLLEKARDKGEFATRTAQGRNLLAQHIAPLAEAIRHSQETGKPIQAYQAGTSARGPKIVFLNELLSVDHEVIAAITLSNMIEAARSGLTLSQVAYAIGKALEEEAQVLWVEKQEPNFLRRFLETIRNEGGRASYAARRLNKEMKGRLNAGFERWPVRVRYQLGAALAAAALQFTGLFDREPIINVRRGKPDTRIQIVFTAAAEAVLTEDLTRLEDRSALRWPMVSRPLPWSGPWGGGYLTTAVPPQAFVRTANKDHHRMIREAPPVEVFEAVNRIQDTPWQINRRVLDVMRQVWAEGGNQFGLPLRVPGTRAPFKPADPTEEELAAYKAEARRFFSWVVKEEAEVRKVDQMIDLALRFEDEPRIYYPHNVDFRGRIYPIPSILSPQGDDLQKGLLWFANGKPLRYEEDADWLAIHGANTYGYDKASLDERVQWVTDHESAVLALAEDPLSEESRAFLAGADKPWQFLAWAFEWSDYRRSPGEGFVSRIPVALDGTCNGLQHLSAMAADERGGAFVNLVPTDRPADVYAEVARRTVARLEEIAWLGEQATTDEERARARWATAWLAFGIDRKLTKRTVMVVPYGGTMQANRQYVRQAIRERGGESPFRDDEWFAASNFLALTVWESLGDVLLKARGVMAWLQGVARVLAEEGKPVRWVTPVGFPVLQAYFKQREARITFGIRRERVKMRTREATTEINGREQAQGMSPNFTHSLDAAHLVATVNRGAEYGLDQWAMVHDSYAVPAADVAILTKVLRAEFAAIYSAPVLADLTAQLRAQADNPAAIPDPPALGSWQACEVLKSPFFFH